MNLKRVYLEASCLPLASRGWSDDCLASFTEFWGYLSGGCKVGSPSCMFPLDWLNLNVRAKRLRAMPIDVYQCTRRKA